MERCWSCGAAATCAYAYWTSPEVFACERHDPLEPPMMTTGGLRTHRRLPGGAQVIYPGTSASPVIWQGWTYTQGCAPASPGGGY